MVDMMPNTGGPFIGAQTSRSIEETLPRATLEHLEPIREYVTTGGNIGQIFQCPEDRDALVEVLSVSAFEDADLVFVVTPSDIDNPASILSSHRNRQVRLSRGDSANIYTPQNALLLTSGERLWVIPTDTTAVAVYGHARVSQGIYG